MSGDYQEAMSAAQDMLQSSRRSRNNEEKLNDLLTAAMHVGVAVRSSVRTREPYFKARALEKEIREAALQMV